MDAVGPDIDIAPDRQIFCHAACSSSQPSFRLLPTARCIFAEQRGQCVGEVAGRDTFQVKDRQQRLDRHRAAHVGRQDRRREADTGGVICVGFTVTHTWLANRDRADAGRDFALGWVAMAHDALMTILGLEIAMPAEKIRDLRLGRLGRLGQQGACLVAQNFSELVVWRLAESA